MSYPSTRLSEVRRFDLETTSYWREKVARIGHGEAVAAGQGPHGTDLVSLLSAVPGRRPRILTSLEGPVSALTVVPLLVLAAALIVLAKSADHFVEGAARLALQLRVSAVVVGAVVIGFGTSLPEMLVSGLAAAEGESDIAFGNVVGSNVANLSLVLGAAAVFGVLRIGSTTLRREAPLAVAAVIALALLAQGEFTRMEGMVLIVGLVAAVGWIVVAGRGDATMAAEVEEFFDDHIVVRTEAIRCGLGMAGTVIGAQALVWSATSIATDAGLSGGFVGFTIVAVGTSLPELVTSFVAARRNEADLVIGNLLGSNLFNSLAVGGVIALVAPGPIGDSTLLGTGVLFMVAVAIGSWVLMITGSRVVRWEGLVLLCLYALSVIAMSSGSADEHTRAPNPGFQIPDPGWTTGAEYEAQTNSGSGSQGVGDAC